MKSIQKAALKALVYIKKRGGGPKDIKEFRCGFVKRVLVVSSTAIGDALFATAAIRAIRNLVPEAAIDFVLRDKVAPIFTNYPLVDKIITYKGRYRNALQLANIIKKRGYDLCLVFHDSDPCLCEAAFVAGVPFIFRIGQKDEKCAHLLSARIPYDNEKHAIDQRLEVVRRVFDVPLSAKDHLKMELPVKNEEVLRYRSQLLKAIYGTSNPKEDAILVAFQFAASGHYKEWPMDHFVELAYRLLLRQENINIVLIGGPSDRRRAERIRDRIIGKIQGQQKGVINLAGKVSLKDLPFFLKAVDLLVTNDTGPLHVAIAVGTKTVSLFVPSNVEGTGPVQDLHLHRVITRPKPCTPCVEKYCKRPSCMGLITVEDVEREVLGSLGLDL